GKPMWPTLRVVIASALACALASGCRQPPVAVEARFAIDPSLLMTPCAAPVAGKPPACGEVADDAAPSIIGPVSTVTSPEKTKREICLAECIALALENGRTGTFFDGANIGRRTSAAGLTREAAPSAATDSIRVVAYDPAILATQTEE